MTIVVKMQVVIDTRESKLVTLYGQDACTVQALDLGDVQIKDNGETRVIFERKTLADMAASVKDGRWKEQKLRLMHEREASQNLLLIYIIEDNRMGFNEEGTIHGIHAKSLVTMILNTMLYDRINVVFTKNVVDTCDFVKAFVKRFDDPACQWCTGRKELCLDSYQDAVIKAKKKENVNNDTVFNMQLCAIPGISTKKAVALREAMGVNSMAAFLDVIRESGTKKNAIKKLAEAKGLGKVLAENIVSALGITFSD